MNIHEHIAATIMVKRKGSKYIPFNPMAVLICKLVNGDAFNHGNPGSLNKRHVDVLKEIGFEVEEVE